MQLKITVLSFLILSTVIQCKDNADIKTKRFLEEGKEIAIQAKAEIGKNLMNAIQAKGIVGSIEFCNTNAISLTNEISQKQNVKLKRVTDRPRNPDNTASEEELKILQAFKAQIVNKEKPSPVTVETEVAQIGYYPIETVAMCLQCHGEKEKNISKEVATKLSLLYPTDKAIGYSENQLRGMWVVERKKSMK